jgi:hypothetical protein
LFFIRRLEVLFLPKKSPARNVPPAQAGFAVRFRRAKMEVAQPEDFRRLAHPVPPVQYAHATREMLEEAHQERMRAYEYIGSEEHKADILKDIVAATHSDITPPWEE